MVRYLVEDTPLIPFLINNKPRIVEQQLVVPASEEDKSEADKATEISEGAAAL